MIQITSKQDAKKFSIKFSLSLKREVNVTLSYTLRQDLNFVYLLLNLIW